MTLKTDLPAVSFEPSNGTDLRVDMPEGSTRSFEEWQRSYRRLLLAVDLLAILVSTATALLIRFGERPSIAHGYLNYVALSVVLVPVWMLALMWRRAYEIRYLETGAEEFKRVAEGSLQLMAAVGLISYIGKLELARGYVAVAFPMGIALLLLGRFGSRRWLRARRAEGLFQHQVVAVGSAESIVELCRQLTREPGAGFNLRGVCVPRETADMAGHVNGVPVIGSFEDVVRAVKAVGADTVVIVPGPGLSSDVLRGLAWQLEGQSVDLLVTPALTDVAGPRINIRPVAGLPLLHVEEPELDGPRQVVKAVIERCVATVGSLVLLPFFAALIVAVRAGSAGPAVFKQTRIGKHGREFTVYKLRTMYVGAESQLASIRADSDGSNVLLFKMRQDPRVTSIGRILRKWSIDELPQLWNVVRGDMAIVGPRPPLPVEVAEAGSDFARRLLVRPGITGLWQVSGRADLSLEDSVRLDLYYVENWSLALDAMITVRTIAAVVRRKGAY